MNKEINLNVIKDLRVRLDSGLDLLQVILGPRQVGKTTTTLKLIEEHFVGRSQFVSADKIFNADASWLREQWSQAQANKKILFIDEIQKISNWSESIKSLYDEAKRNKHSIQCVLLGSSSLEIQKGLTESLTGRFQLLRAYHWNLQESQEGYDINFEQFLKFGGYPGAYQFINEPVKWADYIKNSIVSTVIEKDILQLNTVKNPALFRQAFEILISYPAQEISYTKLLGQLQSKGNVEIIKHYISLYEGAFLIRALEKFSGKVIKVKTSSPKILPMAPCLYFLSILSDYSSEEKGHVFEMIVGNVLAKTGHELFYWREGKFEIDFVLKFGKKIWAIEVKSGRKKINSGMEAFKKKYPTAKAVYIHPEDYVEFEKTPIGFLEK